MSFTANGVGSGVVNGAINNWSSTCSVNNLPDVELGGTNPISVGIEYHTGMGPTGSCGMFDAVDTTMPDGTVRVSGGTIHLYQTGSAIGACDLTETLAHEMGHMFGLGDAYQCSIGTNIMHADAVGKNRSVDGVDCEGAEETTQNPTPSPTPGPTRTPYPGDGGANTSRAFLSRNSDGDSSHSKTVGSPCGGGGDVHIITFNPKSPIVVNLNRGGFRFTDIENGVFFDMNGDDLLVQMSWTDPAKGDAFLGLDRNNNGTIDNGLELFGNFSDQPASDNPNGYLALSVFDRPENGGNSDGVLSTEDSVFASLLLWVDSNQNGYSESHELSTIASSGISSLDLAYVECNRQDKYGNLMPYKSKANLAHGGVVQTVDVFFLTYEE